jgi:hypothetical protein
VPAKAWAKTYQSRDLPFCRFKQIYYYSSAFPARINKGISR